MSAPTYDELASLIREGAHDREWASCHWCGAPYRYVDTLEADAVEHVPTCIVARLDEAGGDRYAELQAHAATLGLRVIETSTVERDEVITARAVTSEPGAPVTVTALTLSPNARRALGLPQKGHDR